MDIKFKELEFESKKKREDADRLWNKTKDLADILLKFMGLGIVVKMAYLSYEGDKDLKLVNGRIWNQATALIGKIKLW